MNDMLALRSESAYKRRNRGAAISAQSFVA
jgi:hypothetical protein